MDKISIIVPVYNVEPYLRKCIDSIVSQKYENIEILLINDGSTDNSGNICSEYSTKDKRIRVFHQSNKGVSAAMNVGLENMVGNYVCFADPDDWVEPDWCLDLYDAVMADSAQIGISSYFIDTDVKSMPQKNIKQIRPGKISKEELLIYPLKRDFYMGFCGYVWNKIFSADIINLLKLRFDEAIKYGSDVLFYMNYILSQDCNGAYVDKSLYHYYQRNNAITKSTSYEIKLDILKVYKCIEEMFHNNGYKHLCFWARGFYCHHAGVIANIAIKNNDKKMLLQMQNEIKHHLDDYSKTNEDSPEKIERMYNLANSEIV